MSESTEKIIEGLYRRIAQALEGFVKLNKAAPDDLAYAPTPGFQHNAQVACLVTQLTEAGLVDLGRWHFDSCIMMADQLEQELQMAAANLKQTTGIVVALGLAGRPQG